ncbi:MAG: DUF1905 domain-containing protein [Chloroflexi bacterium]|nr:DUF1905 domain-containing protein [Chloroflexota bacterium]
MLQDENVNATGIPVPPEAIRALGSHKRPPVIITVNGYSYRSTVAPYGDVFMLPLSQEHRKAAGVTAGQKVEVTLQLDEEPRTVEVPADLAAALAAQPGAEAAFAALAYSKRKEFVRQVNDAKAQATRERRIASIVAQMAER